MTACARRKPCGSRRWNSGSTLAQQALPQSGITAESLKTLFDPGQWAQAGLGPLDAAIEHLVEGPSYATLWTLDRKILKAQKLRGEWAKDLAAFQLLMHGAWSEAVKRFLEEINDAQGAPITSWRELIDVWVKIANETLLATHRTPEFLEAQRRLTRSSAECRLQEREIAEAFCEMQQTPTRTEMDEVQREVYELRRRLRALEKSGTAAAVPSCFATRHQEGRSQPRRQASAAQFRSLRSCRCTPAFNSIRCRWRSSSPTSASVCSRAVELLRSVKDRDVQIATTPKTEVFRQDKTTLYHYEPMAKRTVAVPVLVVYGLVGRYTMADLQEDRSLIRNLLLQGVDLYAVDWGNPGRGDRWLTIDDYVDGYLNECIEFICREHGLDSINVLGICEGGVFTLCHAALHPERVKNLIVTITPVDFHADQAEGRTRPWVHQPVDAQPDAGGRRPADRGERQSAGRAHELRVLHDDPDCRA